MGMQCCCSPEIIDHDELMAEHFIERCNDDWIKVSPTNLNPTDWLKENLCSPDKLFGLKGIKDSENGWLMDFGNKRLDLNSADNDTLYVMLVSGILKKSVTFGNEEDGGKDEGDKEEIHPIVIASSLVTEKNLKRSDDPIKVAIKVRAVMRNIWGKRSRVMYNEAYEAAIRKIPRDFVESMVRECISPKDTKYLLDIEDKEILFALREGKFREVIQDTAYKKLYREKVFWEQQVHDGIWFFLITCPMRFFLWIIWNFVYVFQMALFLPLLCKVRLLTKSQTRQLFSPISCFIADIVNFIIMAALIGEVLFLKGARTSQELAEELALNFTTDPNMTVDDHADLKAGDTEGTTKIKLEKSPMSLAGYVLFFCFLSRFLVELEQLSQKRIFSVVPKQYHTHIWCGRKFWKKFKLYFNAHSYMNKVDLLALIILGIALVIDIDYSFESSTIYGKICKDGSCAGILEDRRVIHMINCYSLALLLSVIRLFYCIFEYVPVIGPILISMQKMLKDVVRVLIIVFFLSIGFFIPLLAISQVYRSVYYGVYTSNEKSSISEAEEEGDVDNKIFKKLGSLQKGFYTMILSLMSGRLTNAQDVYDSKDPSINGFFFVIMVGYFLLVGLLCFNLLIALVTKRYDVMMGGRDREWELYKFNVVLDYCSIGDEEGEACNDGMPFFFPISLLYIPCVLFLKLVRRMRRGKKKYKATSKVIVVSLNADIEMDLNAEGVKSGENYEKGNGAEARADGMKKIIDRREVLRKIIDRRDRTFEKIKK